jgi:hypothetical protein
MNQIVSFIISFIFIIELYIGGKSLFTGKFSNGELSINGYVARLIGICNILPVFIWLLLIYLITQIFGISLSSGIKAIRMIISAAIALSFGVVSTMVLLRLNHKRDKKDDKVEAD